MSKLIRLFILNTGNTVISKYKLDIYAKAQSHSNKFSSIMLNQNCILLHKINNYVIIFYYYVNIFAK